MKLIKVLSFICLFCFAMVLVGFSGAWGEENTYYLQNEDSILTFSTASTALQNITFYAPAPCDPPSEDPYKLCQKKVGTLWLTYPMTFEGDMEESAKVFFKYVINQCPKEEK